MEGKGGSSSNNYRTQSNDDGGNRRTKGRASEGGIADDQTEDQFSSVRAHSFGIFFFKFVPSSIHPPLSGANERASEHPVLRIAVRPSS